MHCSGICWGSGLATAIWHTSDSGGLCLAFWLPFFAADRLFGAGMIITARTWAQTASWRTSDPHARAHALEKQIGGRLWLPHATRGWKRRRWSQKLDRADRRDGCGRLRPKTGGRGQWRGERRAERTCSASWW